VHLHRDAAATSHPLIGANVVGVAGALTPVVIPTEVDPETLLDACGAEPSNACEWVLDATGNEALADLADFLVGVPLKILLILLGALVAHRLLVRLVRRAVDRIGRSASAPLAAVAGTSLDDPRAAARAHTIGQVLGSVVGTVVALVAGLLILGELGINLAPLLAGAGIAGIAIGFGAQSLVRDFLAGIFIVVEDQYGVGDVIDAGEASGTVESVSLRSTRLRDAAGTVWHIPNGAIVRVGNQSQRWARAIVDIAVTVGTDLREATRVITEASEAFAEDEEWAPKVLDRPEVLGLERYEAGAASLRITVRTQPGQQWSVARELRLRIHEALSAAGIDVAPVPVVAPPR
jgi:small conductance mechanosensitive channel